MACAYSWKNLTLSRYLMIVTRWQRCPRAVSGRAYYDFVHAEGLSADGLVESSEEAPRYDTLLGPDERWFADRLRDIHDLQHVMTGYGRDPIGEISLLSFMVTQVYNRGIRFIIFMGSRKFQKEHPDLGHQSAGC